jgi:hypothetical protein
MSSSDCDAAERVFGSAALCAHIVAQATLSSRDVAACACVNKALCAAALVTWPAVLVRELPHAVSSRTAASLTPARAVATLRAFADAALLQRTNVYGVHLSKCEVIVQVRNAAGELLFCGNAKQPAPPPEYYVCFPKTMRNKAAAAVGGVEAAALLAGCTATLFVKCPTTRGKSMVACVFDVLPVATTVVAAQEEAAAPSAPAGNRLYNRHDPTQDAVVWLEAYARNLLEDEEEEPGGRVLAFLPAATPYWRVWHHDLTFLRAYSKDLQPGGQEHPHSIWLALLLHVPDRAGALLSDVTARVKVAMMHYGRSVDENDKDVDDHTLQEDFVEARYFGLALAGLSWRKC